MGLPGDRGGRGPGPRGTAVPPADADQPGQMADVLRDELATPASERADPALTSMLFMSGGGEHGAFSAGILDEWAKREGGKLPKFQVVTGISTDADEPTLIVRTGTSGSIIAGFLFKRVTAERIAARSTSKGTPVKS